VSAASNLQGMTPRRDRAPAAAPQPTRSVTRPEMLPQSFYVRDDVVAVSRDLLGKVLCTDIDGRCTSMVITETEAYAGVTDKASHAYGDRRTRRTEPMYGPGGMAYVYLCYGIHHLFNVVTNVSGVPHAVLVRAGEPHSGLSTMLERRGKPHADRSLLAGPGSVARALGITTSLTGSSLLGGPIRIEDHGLRVDEACVSAGPRVGVDYAGEDAGRPYRFRLESDAWVSSALSTDASS
jgi:DNA-3-methyladenine glycosylase